MKFHIFGADESSGVDRTMTVEADSERLAYAVAKEQGVLLYEVIPAGDVQSDDARFHKPRESHVQRKQEESIFQLVAGAGALLILGLFCTLIWTRVSSRAPNNSDVRTYLSFTSTEPSSGPIPYPEGGSRDWSNVSGIETLDFAAYQIPKDPELQRQYFEDMEAENERTWQELVRDGIVTE